jgi:predicted metal-binding membrane protein
VGTGCFFIGTVFGAVVFAVGAALASIEMQQPKLAHAVPVTAGVVVPVAGAVQFTTGKANRLACYREVYVHGCGLTGCENGVAAWRLGLTAATVARV